MRAKGPDICNQPWEQERGTTAAWCGHQSRGHRQERCGGRAAPGVTASANERWPCSQPQAGQVGAVDSQAAQW